MPVVKMVKIKEIEFIFFPQMVFCEETQQGSPPPTKTKKPFATHSLFITITAGDTADKSQNAQKKKEKVFWKSFLGVWKEELIKSPEVVFRNRPVATKPDAVFVCCRIMQWASRVKSSFYIIISTVPFKAFLWCYTLITLICISMLFVQGGAMWECTWEQSCVNTWVNVCVELV